MKLTDRPKNKILLLVALALVGLLAVVGTSFAAYNSQDAQRGVVRNRDTEVIRFTSNYLQTCKSTETNYIGKVIAFDETDKTKGELTVDIYVYNYATGNRNLVSEKDITYTMAIKITDGTKDEYTVKYDNKILTKSEDEYSKEATLTGRTPNEHHYTVTISGADLDKIKITAVATPTNLSITGNQKLAAVLAPSTTTKTQDFVAKGKFLDKTDDNSPTDYDGLNYEISISTGTATATLTWNPTIVEIDPYFLKKITYTELTDGRTGITFTMNQSNGTGDYLIPFYWIKKPTSLTWEQMEDYIKFDAKKQGE